jgi:hypothetical protein
MNPRLVPLEALQGTLAIMHSVSDLVADSRLETSFPAKFASAEGPQLTLHIFTEAGRKPHQRLVRREEVWQRERSIGGGAFGTVWLERRIDLGGGKEPEYQDEDFPVIRAVKQIRRPSQNGGYFEYGRELEAIAKFSHRKVCQLSGV